MEEVVIVGAVRTPFGKLGGQLSSMSAMELGAAVIREVVHRTGLEGDQIDQVIMGTVVSAGLGQVPARQAAILAGLPIEVPALTINKVCASGLKAANLGAQMIRAGDARAVVAGGMESMSRAPYLVEQARFGYRMGNGELVDSMLRDGLTCPVGCVPMHEYGSDVALEFEISREDQDRWAMRSQVRHGEAEAAGKFDDEIVPIEVSQKKGTVVVRYDEAPRHDTTLEALSDLKPLKTGGTITAGNAPGVNDGAAAIILMARSRADELGIVPLAVHVAQGEGNAEPRYLHTVPAYALKAAVQRAGISMDDIELFEINEAFAAVTLTTMQILGLNAETVNVNGGAVAVGHPIGASGARILGTLVHEMRRRGIEYGAASICSGLAQGEATIVRLAS